MKDGKDSAPCGPSMEIKPAKMAGKPNYPALIIVGAGAAAVWTAVALNWCQRTQLPRELLRGTCPQMSPGVCAPVFKDAAQEDAPARAESNERSMRANDSPAAD